MSLRAAILLSVVLSAFGYAQTSAGTQQSSPGETQRSDASHAPLPASPPDAPIPDLGAIPATDQSTSPLKRALRRLDPNCFDGIFHLCWSSPISDEPVYRSYDERRIAEDIEQGNSYLKTKNFRGAEFRFEDVLSYQPHHPEATFKLAESLAKLGKTEEAKQYYDAYLKIAPRGSFAEQAKKALERLATKGRRSGS
jgi:tetratricopeptide (TPR) repeat protein